MKSGTVASWAVALGVATALSSPLMAAEDKNKDYRMLKDIGLFEKVTGNAECKSCWAVEGKTWFTQRHHRETPDRIEAGEADVGIVWTTEIIEAKKQNRKIDGVAIPAPLNKGSVVGYAIGVLSSGRNQEAAVHYVGYLRSDTAQDIYAKYGFVKATHEDTALKPIL